jgi:hypothetical protein
VIGFAARRIRQASAHIADLASGIQLYRRFMAEEFSAFR